MDLYAEIINKKIKSGEISITIPSLSETVEQESYLMLKRIKAIIEDEKLTDVECFAQIEKIICLFEKVGSNCGTRHDFG